MRFLYVLLYSLFVFTLNAKIYNFTINKSTTDFNSRGTCSEYLRANTIENKKMNVYYARTQCSNKKGNKISNHLLAKAFLNSELNECEETQARDTRYNRSAVYYTKAKGSFTKYVDLTCDFECSNTCKDDETLNKESCLCEPKPKDCPPLEENVISTSSLSHHECVLSHPSMIPPDGNTYIFSSADWDSCRDKCNATKQNCPRGQNTFNGECIDPQLEDGLECPNGTIKSDVSYVLFVTSNPDYPVSGCSKDFICDTPTESYTLGMGLVVSCGDKEDINITTTTDTNTSLDTKIDSTDINITTTTDDSNDDNTNDSNNDINITQEAQKEIDEFNEYNDDRNYTMQSNDSNWSGYDFNRSNEDDSNSDKDKTENNEDDGNSDKENENNESNEDVEWGETQNLIKDQFSKVYNITGVSNCGSPVFSKSIIFMKYINIDSPLPIAFKVLEPYFDIFKVMIIMIATLMGLMSVFRR